jgi:hypothetical protein
MIDDERFAGAVSCGARGRDEVGAAVGQWGFGVGSSNAAEE